MKTRCYYQLGKLYAVKAISRLFLDGNLDIFHIFITTTLWHTAKNRHLPTKLASFIRFNHLMETISFRFAFLYFSFPGQLSEDLLHAEMETRPLHSKKTNYKAPGRS